MLGSDLKQPDIYRIHVARRAGLRRRAKPATKAAISAYDMNRANHKTKPFLRR